MDIDNESLIIFLAIIALALAPIAIAINKDFMDLKNSIINFIQSHTFYLILMVLFFILIIAGCCVFYIRIRNRIKEIKDRKSDISSSYWLAKDYLEKDYKEMDSEQLQKHNFK